MLPSRFILLIASALILAANPDAPGDHFGDHHGEHSPQHHGEHPPPHHGDRHKGPQTLYTTLVNLQTTMVTITSCKGGVCTQKPVITGLTTITENQTVVTTYCPLTKEEPNRGHHGGKHHGPDEPESPGGMGPGQGGPGGMGPGQGGPGGLGPDKGGPGGLGPDKGGPGGMGPGQGGPGGMGPGQGGPGGMSPEQGGPGGMAPESPGSGPDQLGDAPGGGLGSPGGPGSPTGEDAQGALPSVNPENGASSGAVPAVVVALAGMAALIL